MVRVTFARQLLLLLLLTFCFSPSYLFIKLGVQVLPVTTLVFCRISLGALVLYLVLRTQGERMLRYRHLWKEFWIAGLTSTLIPFLMIAYGEKQDVSSAVAGLIGGSIPLFTILIAHYSTCDDKMTGQKMLSLLFGLGGLICLFYPCLKQDADGQLWPTLSITCSSLFYAIGMVYSKKYLSHLPPLVASTGTLVTAACSLFPFALICTPFSCLVADWRGPVTILELGLIGTALAYIIYYKLLRISSASFLSLSSFLFPIVALLLGLVVLKEELPVTAYLGLALILTGLVFGLRPSTRTTHEEPATS